MILIVNLLKLQFITRKNDMKKIYLLLILLSFHLMLAQKKKVSTSKTAEKITAQQAQMSNDPVVIAAFIKANPDDPNLPDLKIKLIELITPADDAKAKPKVEVLTKTKLSKEIKQSGVSDKSKQAARVLNHLFDNNPNKSEAYVQIVNKSKCNMILKFSGKNKFYNLNVSANNKNYILIEKGKYELTTSICDFKYAQSKNIHKDIAITLGSR